MWLNLGRKCTSFMRFTVFSIKCYRLPNWISYWSENPRLFGIVMEQSTGYFAKSIMQKSILKPGLRILDFGCGPGYLTKHLTESCNSYVGVDISENYIQTCKTLFTNTPNYQFICLYPQQGTSGLATANLLAESFDLIIINSVIQYFPSKMLVKELLENCKKLLAPRGTILLADVVTHDKGLFEDALAVFKHSIQNGYCWAFLQFMYRARVSGYNETRKNQPLLSITAVEIETICKQLELNCMLLPGCTLQSSRNTYAISF
jgi:2-polyprenyl-3-methyl-5-hydroxy-6-metoxy-1,4-benzoquinol methylase